MSRPLPLRLFLLGGAISAVAAAATPYVTLKLGLSVDLSFGGMFLAAALLGKYARDRKDLAIQLNVVQTMINAATGVGFMCVILAAFYYIQGPFGRNIGFDPPWWQIATLVFVSANLGVFMGALPRRMLLDDASLPWPGGRAVLSVADTLSDPSASEATAKRRSVLTVSTAVAGFLTFLRDSFGVIPPFVGNATIAMTMGAEFAGIGLGMLLPLSVALSGLIGVWGIANFGEKVAKLTALNGTAPEYWAQCSTELADGKVTDFLTANCGKAVEYLNAGSHFKYIVQWMMWPATAMMIAAALTGVLVPLVLNLFAKKGPAQVGPASEADEHVPTSWVVGGIVVCSVALIALQGMWFQMPWYQVTIAILLQPVMIIAGARVLGITGSGPVSLFTNATQFVFGLLFPAHIMQNLLAAHVSADPQASSESTITAFWVARRLGGSFRALIVAQLITIPICAVLLPIVFKALVNTYGIGFEEGQLAAPTGLKIASLAVVMEKGVAALPHGALTAAIVAAFVGVALEVMLLLEVREANGAKRKRFPWIPVPSAVGFALILPPSVTIAMATGSVISAAWRTFSPKKDGSYAMYAAPAAAGLMAGEAIVGAIFIPLIAGLMEFVSNYL